MSHKQCSQGHVWNDGDTCNRCNGLNVLGLGSDENTMEENHVEESNDTLNAPESNESDVVAESAVDSIEPVSEESAEESVPESTDSDIAPEVEQNA